TDLERGRGVKDESLNFASKTPTSSHKLTYRLNANQSHRRGVTAMPALQLDVVHVGSAQTIRIAPRSGNMSFSHHPTRRMKFNAVAAGFFTSQPSSGDISKFPQKMRRFISKSLAKNKDFSQPYFIFQRVFSGLTGRFVFQMDS